MKENAFTHYTRDNTLYNRLLDAASDDKLPLLDNKSFELLNKTYGKDKMRTHLADYIATERPVFPLKEITKDDMRKSFYDLKGSIYYLSGDTVKANYYWNYLNLD